MYLTLMGWMSWSWQNKGDAGNQFWFAIIATVILAILYAWIVINYRKKEIATLKCIGYTNKNIRVLIIGELVFVTLFAFFILAEGLLHWTAIKTYIDAGASGAPGSTIITDYPILGFDTIMIILSVFLVSQIFGILIMYRKVLQLRPIVALRVLK